MYVLYFLHKQKKEFKSLHTNSASLKTCIERLSQRRTLSLLDQKPDNLFTFVDGGCVNGVAIWHTPLLENEMPNKRFFVIMRTKTRDDILQSMDWKLSS